MKNEDVEEGIEKKDHVRFDGDAVKENGHRLRLVKCVRHEGWLNHDEGVVDVLFVENVTGSRVSNAVDMRGAVLTGRTQSRQDYY